VVFNLVGDKGLRAEEELAWTLVRVIDNIVKISRVAACKMAGIGHICEFEKR
jgi:hypothetical protein